jgi:hypothetical protein
MVLKCKVSSLNRHEKILLTNYEALTLGNHQPVFLALHLLPFT